MSTEKRRGASYLGFVGWWMLRSVARQVGLDVRAQSHRGKREFHELMLRRLVRLPPPVRGVLLGVGVTTRAGWRLAHHGGRSLNLAMRIAREEGAARHAEWLERGEHPRGSSGREHVLAGHVAARAQRFAEHRQRSDEVHAATRQEVRKAREAAALKRLRAAKRELAVAKARGNKDAQKRLGRQVAVATGRLARKQAAVELGIVPAGVVASPGVPASVVPVTVPPGIVPTSAPVPASPAPIAVAQIAVPATTAAVPKASNPVPGGATVTSLPVAPTGPALNGNNNHGGTRTMTEPTTTNPVGEVTTIDEALTAYGRAIEGMVQVSDEQGKAGDDVEAMVILFEGAVGALRLDNDSGNEIHAAMEALGGVAELTRSLAAAALDAAALLENNQRALDGRYDFRERVAALNGGDAMQLSSLKAS